MNGEKIQETVELRPPVARELFAARAARFRSLSAGHALGDYLAAMACLADAQHAAVATVRVDGNLDGFRREFPLNAGEFQRGEDWRKALAVILSEMGKATLPPPSRGALARLSGYPPEELESAAGHILAGNCAALDLACAPFLGAALQTYWTVLAGMAPLDMRARPLGKCPVCASPPVAGIVLGDRKVRYLVCGLCSAEWYLPRVTCAGCGSTAGIAYMQIEGDPGGTRAESCSRCRGYLKLFYLESAPSAEPFADDVATLALDFLMSGEGFSRIGLNLFMVPGFAS